MCNGILGVYARTRLIAGALSSREKSAFFVGLTDNLGPVVENTNVVFDHVVTNVGDSYDRGTGKFTAPANGVYQFNVVISAQGRQKVSLIMPTLLISKIFNGLLFV